jgi:adenylate cyclase
LRARLRAEFRIFVRVVAFSGLGGALYGMAMGDEALDWAQGAATGAAIGAWCASFDLFLLRAAPGRRVRELAFVPHMAIKTVWYVLGIVSFINLGEVAFGDDPGETAFGRTFAFSLAAALVFNFFLMLNRMLGQNVLGAFLTGRYHQPREEERIFLFADLAGSTATAERVGNARFHRLLNDVIMDLTEPVLEAGGEIHAYVGDEVIVTWPLARGLEDAACVRCCLGGQQRLADRAPAYRRAYGVEPRLRMALHAGPVIAGEMGDVKRQIAFLGDAVNAAARLEQACRELDRDVLISDALFSRLDLPEGVRAEALGPIPLRGKAEPTEAFALAREAAR